MNVAVIIWLSVFAATFAEQSTRMIFPMNSAERVTSFAVLNKTVYLTYIDLHKTTGQNGIVKYFELDKIDNDSELKVLDVGTVVMTSPMAVRTDEKELIWILDSGVQNISGTQNKELAPKLFIYDTTRKVVQQMYEIPRDFLKAESFYSNLAIDTGPTPQKTYIYASDFNARKLLVYNVESNVGKIMNHHFFNPDPESNIPLEALYNINKRSVSGLCGLTIVNDNLFYHALASKNDFSISRHDLKYKDVLQHEDSKLVLSRHTEAGVMQFDKNNSVIFYALFKKIGCARVTDGKLDIKYYAELDIGVTDGYITDLQVVGPYLYLLINNENNFEIGYKIINHIIHDTACDYIYYKKYNTAPRQYIDTLVLILSLCSIIFF